MISIADLRIHARTRSGDDAYVTALEAQAVAFVQRQTGRYFGGQEEVTEYVLGQGHRRLWLPEPPYPGKMIASVLERVAPGGASTTITGSDDSGFLQRGSRLVRKANFVWGMGYEYEVTYGRGYPSGSEPADIRRAVMEIVAQWYERRVPVAKASMAEIPLGAMTTIEGWRRLHRSPTP